MKIALAQREKFLEALRAGVRPDIAAADVGATATAMRRLSNRDEEFRVQYEAAMQERREAHADKIRRELDVRAFDRADPSSATLLKLQAEMYLDELAHKREKLVKHGNDGKPFQIQAVMPEVQQATLDMFPLALLEDLLERMRAVEAGDVERLQELTEGIGL